MKLYTDMPRTWEHENSDPSVGIMSDSMFHAQCVPAENSGSADLTGGGPTGKRLRSGFEEFTEEWTCRDCGTIRKFRVEDYTGWDIPEDAEKIAAALRGVGNQKVGVTVDDLALDEMDGNQNAEPRWSANRLEEVLREGLPDQNAEPCDYSPKLGERCVQPKGHGGIGHIVADQKGTEQ